MCLCFNYIILKSKIIFTVSLLKKKYIRSFKKANKDKEMIRLAEEGLEDYLKMIDK